MQLQNNQVFKVLNGFANREKEAHASNFIIIRILVNSSIILSSFFFALSYQNKNSKTSPRNQPDEV